METLSVVVLAAGAGTRMKSPLPKPLVTIDESTLVEKVIEICQKFALSKKVKWSLTIVVGHEGKMVEDHIRENISLGHGEVHFAYQEKMLGTGDAVKTYFKSNKKNEEYQHTFVLCADTPCLKEEDLELMWNRLLEGKKDAVAATFSVETPMGYGRIVRGEKGFKIIEEKDASDEEKKICEVNAGVYLSNTLYLKNGLEKLTDRNAAGEFYLTDIFTQEQNVEAIHFSSGQSFIGVNDLSGLARAEQIIRERRIEFWTGEGVKFLDKSSCYLGPKVSLARGCILYPSTYLEGETTLEEDVVVEPGCIIKNSQLSKGVHLKGYSYLENAKVGDLAVVGPYARLRPGSIIGEESKIGNFVEIKKSVLKKGVKVSHLSYVGDAEIGQNSNIGCGFITCNYDGENKHQTTIGEECFIGSDSQTIAPVSIGDRCFVASGSTINQSMPDGSFAISRGRQNTKEKLAAKFIKSKKK